MSDDVAAALGTFDCCALSDALDKLGLGGCVTGFVATMPGKRIWGRAHTVKLAVGVPPPHAPVRHLCAAAIDAAAPGEVIVVEQRTGLEAGSWGGILSRAARAKGIAGVISEGLVRDVDEAREISFPIFCRGFTALTARGRIHEESTDCPIRVGEVTVRAGDYVVADGSGTVFVSPENAERVLESVTAIAAREAEIVRHLDAGVRASTALGASYEQMLSKED